MIDIDCINFPEIVDLNEKDFKNRTWYLNTYKNLIKKCLNTNYDNSIHTEIHHIIPKCMGGNNSKNNLVKVDIRSHVYLHILLSKSYPDNHKLLHAVTSMFTIRSSEQAFIRNKDLSKIPISTIVSFREKWISYLKTNGIITKNGISFKLCPVVCYLDDFTVIRTYVGVRESEKDGFSPTCVSSSCKNKTKYAGYNWDYLDNFKDLHHESLNIFNKLEKLPELNDYVKLTTSQRKSISSSGFSDEDRRKAMEVRSKKVQIPNGKIVKSLREAERITGIDRHKISNLAKDNKSGFKFITFND